MYTDDKVTAYITSKELLFNIESLDELRNLKVNFGRRLESRTRHEDLTDALRFRVHDPLWMLSRQWQLGEFKGNNAGSALNVKCRVNRKKAAVRWQPKEDMPIEPEVEGVNHDITPLMRVEAAMYFLDLLQGRFPQIDRAGALKALRELFPLGDLVASFGHSSFDEKEVQDHTRKLNARLGVFSKSFAKKLFDGIELYENLAKQNSHLIFEKLKPCGKNCVDFIEERLNEVMYYDFFVWVQKTYFPRGGDNTYWKNNQLGYDCQMEVGQQKFEAKDYSSGELSWYSFDVTKEQSSRPNDTGETENIWSIPTLATFPGAPSKRLWEFEDNKVFLGNAVGMQAKGNIAMMQYATMYGNDWMLIPLTAQLGTYFSVERIEVADSFGIVTTITSMSGSSDDKVASFGQRWQMYGNVRKGKEKTVDKGLFLPPALNHIMESKPVEEVQMLRDEMANMVWGVETSASDGCGGNIDLVMEAAQVQAFMDEQNAQKNASEKSELSLKGAGNGSMNATGNRPADYAYVLQTQVPLNWIPFVPQHPAKDKNDGDPFFLGGRDIVLRRGKMPRVVNGKRVAALPRTQFLSQGLRRDLKNDNYANYSPLFINEEEVQQVGTRVVKNFQRARWINGQTFNWLGYQTQIKGMQADSGLKYDSLIDVNVQKKDA
jgi:hypothetical protein